MGWLIGIGVLQLAMLVFIQFRLEHLVDERMASRLADKMAEAIRDQGRSDSN